MTASYEGVGKLGFGAMRLPLTEGERESILHLNFEAFLASLG